MGKGKKRGVANRAVKGVKTSSSAHASAVLADSGLSAGGGFIGFSSFATTSAHGPATGGSTNGDSGGVAPFYTGDDSGIGVLFKGVAKKDATTKLKSLQELLQKLSHVERKQVAQALPHYGYLFVKLLKSNDRRIRLIANTLLHIFALKGFPKLFTRIRDDVILTLWSACFDPYRAASEKARATFLLVFPGMEDRKCDRAGGQKGVDGTLASNLYASCDPKALRILQAGLKRTILSSPRDLSDKNDDDETVKNRYERTLVMALHGLGTLLRHKPEAGELSEYQQFFGKKQFWNLISSKNSRIRNSMFAFFTDLMGIEDPSSLAGVLPKMANAILSYGLKEQVRDNVGRMWDAALTFMRMFPNFHEQIDVRKSVYPRIWSMIDSGFFGAEDLSCPKLLPLISLLPASYEGYNIKNDKRVELIQKLMQHLNREPLATVGDGLRFELIVQAILECSSFMLMWVNKGQKQGGVNDDTSPALLQLQVFVLHDAVLRNLVPKIVNHLNSEIDAFRSLKRRAIPALATLLVQGIKLKLHNSISSILSELLKLSFRVLSTPSNNAIEHIDRFFKEFFECAAAFPSLLLCDPIVDSAKQLFSWGLENFADAQSGSQVYLHRTLHKIIEIVDGTAYYDGDEDVVNNKFLAVFASLNMTQKLNPQLVSSFCSSFHLWVVKNSRHGRGEQKELLTLALRNLCGFESGSSTLDDNQILKTTLGMKHLHACLPNLDSAMLAVASRLSPSTVLRAAKVDFFAYVCNNHLAAAAATFAELSDKCHRALSSAWENVMMQRSVDATETVLIHLEFAESLLKCLQQQIDVTKPNVGNITDFVEKTKARDVLALVFVFSSVEDEIPVIVSHYGQYIWENYGDGLNAFLTADELGYQDAADSGSIVFNSSLISSLQKFWRHECTNESGYFLWMDVANACIDLWNRQQGETAQFLKALGVLDAKSWDANGGYCSNTICACAAEVFNHFGVDLFFELYETSRDDLFVVLGHLAANVVSLAHQSGAVYRSGVAECFNNIIMPLVTTLSLQATDTNTALPSNVGTQFLHSMFRFGFSNAGEVSSFALDALDHMFVQISDNVRAFRVWQDKNKGDEGSKKAGPESDEEEEEVDEVPVETQTKKYSRGDTVRYMSHDGKKGEIAVIVGVHTGEAGGLPFYTVRLSTGREKQTELSRLRPITSYILPTFGSEKGKNSGGKSESSKKQRAKSRKKRARRLKKKRSSNAGRDRNIVDVCQWDKPGHVLGFLTVALDEIRKCFTMSHVQDWPRACNGTVLSLIPSLSHSLLPLLSDEDRDEFGAYLTEWIEELLADVPPPDHADSADSKIVHFLVHISIISGLFASEDLADQLELIGTVSSKVMPAISQICSSIRADMLGNEGLESVALLSKYNLMCLFYAYVAPLVQARSQAVIDLEEFFQDTTLSALSYAINQKRDFQFCTNASKFLQLIAKRCSLTAPQQKQVYQHYICLCVHRSKQTRIEAFSNRHISRTITTLTRVLSMDIGSFIQDQMYVDPSSESMKWGVYDTVDLAAQKLLWVMVESQFPVAQVFAYKMLTILGNLLSSLTFGDLLYAEFCRHKENPRASKSIALLLLWQLWMARIKHDRAGSSGKTLLELDNRNEIFLKYILEKSSVALSLFPTNRNSVGQKQIYSVTGGTVAFLNNGQDHNVSSWSDLFESSVSNICGKSKHNLAWLYTVFSTVLNLPAMTRSWWLDLDRSENSKFADFMGSHITPAIIKSEMSAFGTEKACDEEGLKVEGSTVSREVLATYEKEECKLEMVLSLPATYPLRAVEVNCRKLTGIRHEKWRRWAIQIVSLLSSRDGSLNEGIMLWKRNVDEAMDGVEPCPICYAVVQVTDRSLPKVSCKVCHTKFHSVCIYKWFSNASKSTCPMCRSSF